MKASQASEAKRLEDIPNIGPNMARDLSALGLHAPMDLKGRDPFLLYKKLCEKTDVRHDPCVLDTFMAAVDFMSGAPARPWWEYTAERKKLYGHELRYYTS